MKARPFTIAHINIRALLAKFNDVKKEILYKNYTILAISETWLNSNINSAALQIDGYSFIRKDRIGDTRGGGVGMYISNNIKFSIIQSRNDIEQLWVSTKINGKVFLVGTIYRPPNYDYNIFLNSFENTVINDLPGAYEHLFCLGDFNIDQLQIYNSATKLFSNVIDCLGFEQIINEPTRTTNTTSSIIDLILTNDSSVVTEKGVLCLHNISDHDLIYCKINIAVTVQPRVIMYRDYKNLNMVNFNRHLHSLPLFHIIEIENIDNKLHFLNKCLLDLYDTHIPLKSLVIKGPYTPWVTYNLKQMMKSRDKAHMKYLKNKTQDNWEYYKSLRNFTNRAVKREKKAYVEYKLKHTATSQVWRELKKLNVINNKTSDIPLELQNAEEINNFFLNSVPQNTNNNKHGLIQFYESNTKNNVIDNFRFSPVDDELVGKIINSLHSKATGDDGIDIAFIKLCCPYIIPIVTHLVNFCIEHSIYPDQWKIAIVKPIPKLNEITEYKHLRPVCILSAMSKVLEKIMEYQLRTHLKAKQIIPEFQSGFRPQHSCLTALLNITDDVLSSADEGKITALVLLDFSKAFDTLDHEILIAILHFIGLDHSAVLLIQNYLIGRKQRVMINNKSSSTVEVLSGVPQGSILGPLLYTIYTSKFSDCIMYCKHSFYADDTQLYFSFNPSEVQLACENINDDLSRLLQEAKNHSLNINPVKSSLILFGRSYVISEISERVKVKIDNEVIPVVNETKNLGVIFDSGLRFKKQVSNMIRNAYFKLKILFNSRHLLSHKLKITLCELFVLSQFNYCSTLYGFCIDKQDSNRIQKVQNACIRFIYGIRKYDHVTYKLKELKWITMENKRKYHALCFFHKLIKLKSPQYLYNKIRFRTDVHNINIRKKDMLSLPPHKTSLFQRSFSYNVVKMYNGIKPEFKSMSPCLFKRKVKNEFLMNT